MTAPFPRYLYLCAALMLASMLSLPAHAFWGSKKNAAEEAGAVLFRDKGCAHCHGVNLEGTKKAPPIADIRKNKLWPPAKMTEQILNGGKKMPPFADSLTDQEISQLVAYLRAKHRPVPPPVSTASTAE